MILQGLKMEMGFDTPIALYQSFLNYQVIGDIPQVVPTMLPHISNITDIPPIYRWPGLILFITVYSSSQMVFVVFFSVLLSHPGICCRFPPNIPGLHFFCSSLHLAGQAVHHVSSLTRSSLPATRVGP